MTANAKNSIPIAIGTKHINRHFSLQKSNFLVSAPLKIDTFEN